MNVKIDKKNFLKAVKKTAIIPKEVLHKNFESNDNRLFLTSNRLEHIVERYPELKDKIDYMIESIKSRSIRAAIKDDKYENTINIFTNNNNNDYFMITIKLCGNEKKFNSIITARQQNKKIKVKLKKLIAEG